ncbi:MAG TPA: hypothetical protein PLM16_00205 [Candidatus Woesebacteria bacterium]|nr:hypothetical protein [Candidatus Woesebacteria bacterium]
MYNLPTHQPQLIENSNQPLEKPKSKSSIIFIGIVSLLLLVLGGFLFYQERLASQTTVQERSANQTTATNLSGAKIDNCSEGLSTDQTFEAIPESKFLSYPIVKDDQLVLIPIQNGGDPVVSDLKVKWGRGTSGYGSSEPLSSPDNKIVAVIDKETQNLLLLTADGENEIQITSNMSVEYISGWSPDSKKLII